MRRLPATTVFYGLEFGLSMPAFVVAVVYFVREVHMSPLQLVATGTVMEVAVFLFEVPTGAIADTYGRRLSLTIAFLVEGAAWIVVGAVPHFWAIALAWFLWGFGATFESGVIPESRISASTVPNTMPPSVASTVRVSVNVIPS